MVSTVDSRLVYRNAEKCNLEAGNVTQWPEMTWLSPQVVRIRWIHSPAIYGQFLGQFKDGCSCGLNQLRSGTTDGLVGSSWPWRQWHCWCTGSWPGPDSSGRWRLATVSDPAAVTPVALCRMSSSLLSWTALDHRRWRQRCRLHRYDMTPTHNLPYNTIRDAILTCTQKPPWVSLIYRTEPTTTRCKNRKTEKLKTDMLRYNSKQSGESM